MKLKNVLVPSILAISFKGHRAKASVIFKHPHHDLAVLEIEGVSPCRMPLFPGYESFTGKNGLVIVGYSPTLSRANTKPTIYVNEVSEYEREHREWTDRVENLITFDAPYAEGGHSGGPIFGEGGGVVAVTT